MKQNIVTVALLLVVLGFSIYKLSSSGLDKPVDNDPGLNVSMVEGRQVIEINAQEGYSPRKTTAKAGVPTVLRVSTDKSYDCSTALRIPKLNIAKNLEPTATTEVDLGVPQAGKMRGLCGMGMYSFEINFQS